VNSENEIPEVRKLPVAVTSTRSDPAPSRASFSPAPADHLLDAIDQQAVSEKLRHAGDIHLVGRGGQGNRVRTATGLNRFDLRERDIRGGDRILTVHPEGVGTLGQCDGVGPGAASHRGKLLERDVCRGERGLAGDAHFIGTGREDHAVIAAAARDGFDAGKIDARNAGHQGRAERHCVGPRSECEGVGPSRGIHRFDLGELNRRGRHGIGSGEQDGIRSSGQGNRVVAGSTCHRIDSREADREGIQGIRPRHRHLVAGARQRQGVGPYPGVHALHIGKTHTGAGERTGGQSQELIVARRQGDEIRARARVDSAEGGEFDARHTKGVRPDQSDLIVAGTKQHGVAATVAGHAFNVVQREVKDRNGSRAHHRHRIVRGRKDDLIVPTKRVHGLKLGKTQSRHCQDLRCGYGQSIREG
jgi:hypothetical protein